MMSSSSARRGLIAIAVAVVVLLVVLFWSRHSEPLASSSGPTPSDDPGATGDTASRSRMFPFKQSHSAPATTATAEEIVANKLNQFARSRREIMRAMAQQKNVEIPDGAERFFDALEAGDWSEIKAAFDAINGGEPNAGFGSARSPAVTALWAPIIDAYGVAQQVHLWPAQKLLDYGDAVLSSLRPGMVYVGGTDEGRWVPTFLNETSDGERHIVITQNGLADGTYQEYMRVLYGDRFNTINSEESQRAFQEYVSDAQKRFEHDQKFPDEPKQIRPNEQVQIVDGKTQVSGIVAVMDINERLLRTLMDKNPELSFALQESVPFKGTYAEAAPLGSIMELRAQDQAALTPERTAQSVDYWRSVAEQLRASPDESSELTALKSFSKLAVGQASLFAERGLSESAEQTYRIALGMLANNTDAAVGLADLLDRTGRADEGRALLEKFTRDYPKQVGAMKDARMRGRITVSSGR